MPLFVGENGLFQVVAEDSCELCLESVDRDMLIDLEKRKAPQKESPLTRTQIPKQGRRRNEDSLEDGNSQQPNENSNRSSSTVLLLSCLHRREEAPFRFRNLHLRVPVYPTNLLFSVATPERILDPHRKRALPNLFQKDLEATPNRAIPIHPSPIKAFAIRSENGNFHFCQSIPVFYSHRRISRRMSPIAMLRQVRRRQLQISSCSWR